MYQVTRYGKSSIRRTFATYEAARQAARKLARQTATWQVALSLLDGNPSLRDFGFSVKKI